LNGSEIAIVGMACRFPGAPSVRQFWQNLVDGVESLSLLSDDDLRRAGVDPAVYRRPDYVRAASVLDGVELWDAAFFGYTRLEAELMDPQHRLFLECAWQSLEDAGYDSATYSGTIGVFTGAKTNTYLFNLFANRERFRTLDTLQIALGGDLACMATRVSYKLDLKGPSYALHTACSTSLVAVHLACQSLLIDECRMAIAGGAAINVPHRKGYVYQPGGILSPDGSCRTFDAKAAGSNFGNGVGAVVLKRLEDALADGDHVYAVIKGSAANNDGAAKASYTAPGVAGQTSVILEALAVAGVPADSISYVEAHGTATALGDSIEMLALTNAYRASTARTGFCAIGSVKTNVGHLETAAGVAGLIKTALALEHRTLPPSLHFEEPNPKIDFAASPFHVVDRLSEWPAEAGEPRRAGLSSFGIGSTNVHMILEEAPAPTPSSASRPWQLVLLSARTETALAAATANLASHLRENPEPFADAAYTLKVGRRPFAWRRALVCRDGAEATAALDPLDPERVLTHHEEAAGRGVVFLFPGLGDHYVGMGLGLYRTEPAFRDAIDRCADLLTPHLGLDLRDVLYPDDPDRGQPEGEPEAGGGVDLRQMLGRPRATATPEAAAAAERLNQTAVAQPALFAVEYALARLWMEWGITPRALLGYSLGEYVAACLAGVFSLPDALMLVARRARMIQELPPGAMLAVPLAESELGDLLGREGGLSLAAVNGPRQSVLAGPLPAIAAAERRLAEREIASRRLPTTHAFHSTMMEPIAAAYEAVVRTVSLHPPTIPYVSNLTGGWARPEEVTDPAYWARHMREAVRFADGVRELWQEPGRVLLEVGPGLSLSSLAKLHPACDAEASRRVLASLPASYVRQPDTAFLLGTLGRLWLTGVPIDWSGFYAHERRRRVPLPTYPFERQRYWIDGAESEEPAGGAIPGLEKKSDIGDWFYRPVWEPAPLPEPPESESAPAGDWIVLEDGLGVGKSLAGRLTAGGKGVLRVRPGAAWARLEAGVYTVRPGEREDWDALLAELRGQGRKLAGIVHLWGLTGAEELEVDAALEFCFYSLLTLAQALGRLGSTDPLKLLVVADRLQQVHPGDAPCPEKAVLLGPARVIPQEYPHIACTAIDVEPALDASAAVALLSREMGAQGGNAILAYRGGLRWALGYEPVKLDAPVEGVPRLRENGVYLITGGLGGVGLVIAEHLARTVHAKLVLTRRSPLPERSLWPEWLAGHGEDDPASAVIRKVWRLEELGAEVMVAAADAVDGARMRAVVEEAEGRFGGIGAIHGVLHAAGIGGGGLIQLKTRRAAAEVLAPKVLGARVLDEIFREEGRAGLDFLLLFSSLQTALGDFGQVDYCAANAYLDALAQRNAALGGPFTLALGWDNWQEVGIAVNAEVPEHLTAWRAEILAKGILPAEGAEVFDRALSADLPQVVVTTQDLTARIAQSHSYTGDRVMQQLGGPGAGAGAAPAGGRSSAILGGTHVPARGELERRVTAVWQKMLGRDQLGVHDNFFDLGGNSLLGMQLITELNRELDVQIAPVALFEAPTIAALVKYLAPPEETTGLADITREAERTERKRRREERRRQGGRQDLAIVAMTGRFPGADGVDELWRNLCAGVDSTTRWSTEELLAAGIDGAELAATTYVRARPILRDVESFDATLFGYSPREAEVMDPQHRVFLECAWEALEKAGYDPQRYDGLIGVYAGAAISTYLLNLYSNPELIGAVGNFQAMIGNEKDSLATRVSYKLNLKGPSLSVQTFCSTSLVAVHLACQSLLAGECDMALAGGVSIHLPQVSGYHYQEGGFVSRDGRVKAFDASADGFVFGNGAGVVVLKRLDEALADGDRVLAVVKGSAVNNDGSVKVGYTATSVEGQSEVIARALDLAGVSAESIGYVETHGTGTALGDPVEIAAMTKAFAAAGGKAPGTCGTCGTCAIGSIKPNIGHLDRAAGVSGLIKAVLVLERGQIPPSLHFAAPNPKIDFAGSPFYVNTVLRDWQANGAPRRVGVNSLGLGGTNAHVVLEEPAPVEPSGPSRPWQLLLLSAQSRPALEAMTANLAAHLTRVPGTPELPLPDAAYTLAVGRRPLDHRRAVVCADPADAAAALAGPDPKRVLTAHQEEESTVAFLFSGLGGQYVGMGEGLYQSEPFFRAEVDRCADLLEPLLGLDLRRVLYPPDRPEQPAGGSGGVDLRRMLARAGQEEPDEATRLLNQTRITQPALFVVEYALARLWLAWGVRPEILIGYSLGEYVAATLAGVLSLADALTLVARRAQMIEELPAGAMLAVPLPEEQALSRLGTDLSLAAVNGPEQSVLAGPPEAIADLERRLGEEGIVCRRLQTSHAFHSAMMAPLYDRLVELVGTVDLHPPRLPLLSNVTGTFLTPEEATDPTYWARHMCQPVRFADGVRELRREEGRVLLEVGPGQTLCSLILQYPAGDGEAAPVTVGSLRHSYEREADQAYLLGALGKLWLARVAIDWPAFFGGERRLRVPLPTYPFERQRYWVEARAGSPAALSQRVAVGAGGASNAGEPRSAGDLLYVPSWRRTPAPPRIADADLAAQPRRWLILSEDGGIGPRVAERLRRAGHEVATAVPGEDLAARLSAGIEIVAILASAQEVTGEEELRPEGARGLAACRRIPRDFPGLRCRAIDLAVPATERQVERAAEQVLAEILAGGTEELVAYRGNHRWSPALEALAPADPSGEGLPRGGAYLVTGGPAGFSLARALAYGTECRLTLVEPPGQEPEVLAARQATLAELGAEVWMTEADLADAGAARAVVAAARERMGGLDGVVHVADAGSARGLLALDDALGDDPPPLALAVSPMPATSTDATAEALYLESFAAASRQRAGVAWTSILWELRGDFSPVEGARTLARALQAPGSQILVSSRPLRERFAILDAIDSTPREGEATSLSRYSRPNLRVEYVAPSTATEKIVAGVWADLLGVGQVGVHDNFLDLGGDSLLATRLIARMRDAFDLELPVRLFFESSTVAELARAVDELRGVEESEEQDELLAMLAGMSEDEAEAELARLRAALAPETAEAFEIAEEGHP
jgi:acyl transferase domain-containing protein/acyl carrier protein